MAAVAQEVVVAAQEGVVVEEFAVQDLLFRLQKLFLM